ncbi:MAG TPA: hypothetical protein VGE38_00900 [Nocardioides sp.]|uniref:hypothetical protein n=1 Tax=Nocardioides sp. TaxID=35761 RepID=UPI002EDB8B82
MSITTGPGPRRRHRVLGTLVVAVVVLVAAVCWWLAQQSDQQSDDRPAGDPAASATAGPTASSSAAAPSSDDREPGPTPSSGAPSSGSLEPVPYAEITPQPAVPLTATADFGTGLTVEITRIESVRSVAKRPGEISAPAVRLTMRAHNRGAKPIDLEQMVVNLDYGRERTPAVSVQDPGGDPFAGVLAPGAAMRGVYVFNVPDADRGEIRVSTSYTGSAPTLVLAGSVA